MKNDIRGHGESSWKGRGGREEGQREKALPVRGPRWTEGRREGCLSQGAEEGAGGTDDHSWVIRSLAPGKHKWSFSFRLFTTVSILKTLDLAVRQEP